MFNYYAEYNSNFIYNLNVEKQLHLLENIVMVLLFNKKYWNLKKKKTITT